MQSRNSWGKQAVQMRCVGIEVARSASSVGPPMVAEVNVRNLICMVVVAANRLPDQVGICRPIQSRRFFK
jgi:hypothetical protein